MNYDILKRYDGNPILTREDCNDIPGGCNSVFNSSVFLHDGKYKALLRLEERAGLQSIRLAESNDGITFTVHPERLLQPETEEQALYEEAIYDPRVVNIEGIFYVTYAAENKFGCQIAIASTQDFVSFERFGCVAEPTNRNLVLFPEKINGLYYRLDRPFQNNTGHIWLQESPDLIHWGRPRCIIESRPFYWDRGKIGPAAPPIKTDAGWLVIYHGTTPLCNNLIYRLGVALLDLEHPWIVKHRAKAYILSPEAEYERIGDTPNCCFATSAIHNPETDELRIYYGAADQVMALATCQMSELICFCRNQ